MKGMRDLQALLARIDGKGYKAYKALEGEYGFGDYRLSIDHVQGDPFADPSRIRVMVPADRAGFPRRLFDTPVRRIALEDYLGRAVAAAIKRHVKGRRGSGKSGQVVIATSGQQVLRRNALLVGEQGDIEARLQLALPASGRSILGRQAGAMLFRELPAVVNAALYHGRLDAGALERHVDSVEDQDFLRRWLAGQGLVAFIADGAVLPRLSGVDDRPMQRQAIPFRAPASLAREVILPHAGAVRGMGIPAGVSLIVGGGFHGKSTLLNALERGVYNHIPGDGRERVVSLGSAVKIRAEDGRAINGVNISPFIDNLPFGRDTRAFSTENASGSTSQAANIIEALECGARLLLIDEDTSATNFMIRDRRMQALISKEKEPITPLSHRIRELYDSHGVSTVVVMGGSGDYFSEADTVIAMDAYRPREVTTEAKALAIPLNKEQAGPPVPLPLRPSRRGPGPARLSPYRNHRLKIQALGVDKLIYGNQEIDLSGVEQLLDRGQCLAIGYLIHYYAGHYAAGDCGLVEGMRRTLEEVEKGGLDMLLPFIHGDLAMPRLYEVVAAVNRMRHPGEDKPRVGDPS
ncbi:MAG TPA: ATPase [Sedimenticola sp.]|nr:ATPase [Sedimenticola sp.]